VAADVALEQLVGFLVPGGRLAGRLDYGVLELGQRVHWVDGTHDDQSLALAVVAAVERALVEEPLRPPAVHLQMLHLLLRQGEV
jgi:hypothetical protein